MTSVGIKVTKQLVSGAFKKEATNLNKQFSSSAQKMGKSFQNNFNNTLKNNGQLIKKQIKNEEIPRDDREIPNHEHDDGEDINWNQILKNSFEMVNAIELVDDFKKVQHGELSPLAFLVNVSIGHGLGRVGGQIGKSLGTEVEKQFFGTASDFKNDGIKTFSMLHEKYGDKIPDRVETVLSNVVGWLGSKIFGIEPEKRLTQSDNQNFNFLLQTVDIKTND